MFVLGQAVLVFYHWHILINLFISGCYEAFKPQGCVLKGNNRDHIPPPLLSGYLAASLFLHESSELNMLLVNTIQRVSDGSTHLQKC